MAGEEETARRREAQDPSALTTQQILREISMLDEKLSERIGGAVSNLTTRLDAQQETAKAFSDGIQRVPTDVEKAVGSLQALQDERFDSFDNRLKDRDAHAEDAQLSAKEAVMTALRAQKDETAAIAINLEKLQNERFDSVQTQFRERDVRAQESAKQTETAVSAALQAAEKAVGKSEVVTLKQIEQLGALFQTETRALRTQVDDLKDSVRLIQGTQMGQSGQKSDQHSSSSFIIAVVAVLVAIASAVLAALARSR